MALKWKARKSPLYLQMVRNLFLFLTLFTLVLSMINYRLFNDFLNRQAFETNVERLTQVKEKTELVLQEVVNLSYSIAADPSVSNLLGKAWQLKTCYHDLIKLQQRLKAAGSSSVYLHSFYVYSGINRKLLTSAGTYVLEEFYDQDMIKENLASGRRATWLDPREIHTYGQTYDKVITLLIAMPANTKNPTDLLVANISVDALAGLSFASGTTWDVLVTNAAGDTLFSSVPERSLVPDDWEGADLWEAAETARAIPARIGGEGVLITHLSGTVNGWKYIAINTISELYHASRTVLRLALSVSALLLLCALGASCFLGRRYYRPIQALSAFTAEKARACPRAAGSELDAIRENVKDMAAKKEMLEQEMERNREALRDHFLIRLLLGRALEPEPLWSELDGYGIALPEPLAALIVRFSEKRSADPRRYDSGARLHRTCAEALADIAPGMVIDFDPCDCIVLYGCGGEALGRQLAARILSDLKGWTEEKAVVGIGETAGSVAELHRSYRGAEEVLQYAGMAGDNGILYIGDVQVRNESAPDLAAMEQRMNEVCAAVKQGDGALAARRVEESLDVLWTCERLSYCYRNILLTRLIDRLMMILMERGMEHARVLSGGNPFGILARMTSHAEMADWFRQTVGEIAGLVAQQQQNRMYDNIERVRRAIETGYGQPLSVQQLADGVHLNPNYVGRLFREYTGKTILEYLTRVRLDQACLLLANPRLALSEIAERAGFGTQLNMIRAFKKYLGRTPSEQRAWMARELQRPTGVV